LIVAWKSAIEALHYALNFFGKFERGRYFVERYAGAILGILSGQNPMKISTIERECVQDSLHTGVLIVVVDLSIQLKRGGMETKTATTACNNDTRKSYITIPSVCG
jgi:hypothetical protein